MGRAQGRTIVQSVDRDVTWMSEARCAEAPFGTMFPSDGEELTKLVRRYCDRCDVRGCCLEYALANRIDYGLWGGESEAARRRIRRARARAAASG